jgi:hypothetical protein
MAEESVSLEHLVTKVRRSSPLARNRKEPTEEDLRAKAFVPFLQRLGLDLFSDLHFEHEAVDITVAQNGQPILFVELKSPDINLSSSRAKESRDSKRQAGKLPLLFSNGIDHFLHKTRDDNPEALNDDGVVGEIRRLLDKTPESSSSAIDAPIATESDVALKLVAPVLATVGFDPIEDLAFEFYGAADTKPDILVFLHGEPTFSVEVKRPGKTDDTAAQQAIHAGAAEGVPFSILTDGTQFLFFDTRKFRTERCIELALTRIANDTLPSDTTQWKSHIERLSGPLRQLIGREEQGRSGYPRLQRLRPWDVTEVIRRERAKLLDGLAEITALRARPQERDLGFLLGDTYIIGVSVRPLSGRLILSPSTLKAAIGEDSYRVFEREVKSNQHLWEPGSGTAVLRAVRSLLAHHKAKLG